jgi:hypothetical protein
MWLQSPQRFEASMEGGAYVYSRARQHLLRSRSSGHVERIVQLRHDMSMSEEAYGLVFTSKGKRDVIPWHAIWRFEEVTDD